jgi:myo-inositol-1(or 4)-monophosphatase
MTINYEELCPDVIEISRKAAKFILEETKKINRGHIETKGTHNYVTYVDKTAEKIIIEGLKEILPQAGFIAEENTIETEKKDLMWIIDPLDGTTNFIHGLPCFSVSIALMHHNEPVIGVIYDINLDECFYAWEGGPALMNGNPIRVSNAPELKDSLLATGFPYYDYSLLDKYMELFTWCLKNTHGVRRIGSAAIDLAWVACGRFEAFFEYGLNAWDVAAGVLIIKQAGGRIGDFKGGDDYIFGREIIATNSLIYDKFLAKTKEFLS